MPPLISAPPELTKRSSLGSQRSLERSPQRSLSLALGLTLSLALLPQESSARPTAPATSTEAAPKPSAQGSEEEARAPSQQLQGAEGVTESQEAQANACASLISKLRSTRGDGAIIGSLLAPAKLPRWRYRAAKKKLFAEVATAASGGSVEALYTGRVLPSRGSRAPEGFNCEHLWPRAWMGGRKDPLFRLKESDLHNLFPAEMEVNSRRGHLPFGLVKRPSTALGQPSVIGRGEGRGERVEVRAARRGDVARALVYMAARWQMRWPSPHAELLSEWSRLDPPDERERRRDERIGALQGNRNPLVSCPEALPELLTLLKLP